MTEMAVRSSSTRLTVAAAVVGLALGGVLYAVSRGGSDDNAATKHVQPVPSGSLPAEAPGEQGKQYVALFLAVAPAADDPTLQAAQQRAQALGYEGGIGELFCTKGAREQLKLPADEALTAYSIFFTSKADAERVAEAYGRPVVGIASITAGCLD
jgi:hypothetical protein